MPAQGMDRWYDVLEMDPGDCDRQGWCGRAEGKDPWLKLYSGWDMGHVHVRAAEGRGRHNVVAYWAEVQYCIAIERANVIIGK